MYQSCASLCSRHFLVVFLWGPATRWRVRPDRKGVLVLLSLTLVRAVYECVCVVGLAGWGNEQK